MLSQAPILHAAHSLRPIIRDSLRAVQRPMDMIDQIGGWRSVGGVGARYGEGYGLEQQRMWLTFGSLKKKFNNLI